MKYFLSLLPLQILAFVLRNDDEFQLYSQDLILGNKPLIIGSFSKFSPFYNIPNVGAIQNQSQDQFLIFYLQELTTNEIVLFHYVQFYKLTQEIYHILNVKKEDVYFEMKFKMNISVYESIWHFFYLQISSQNNEGLICGYIQSLGQQENTVIDINLLQQSQYLIVVGGSLKILMNDQILNLRSFLGKLEFFLDDEVQENAIQDQNYLQNILNYIEECQNSNQFQQLQFRPTQFKNFNTNIMQMNEFYFIQFWLKVDSIQPYENLIKFNAISINIENPYIGIQLQVFQLSYLLLQQNLNYNIEYQSYQFPYFTTADELIQNSQVFSMNNNLIFEWHLITLTYQYHKIRIEIKNVLSNLIVSENIENVFQYSSSYQLITIGDSANEYFQSTVQSISFNNCPFSMIQPHCHFSCQTCFGPFRINCLTCPDQSNRIYNQDKNTCSCLLFYQEEGKIQCKGLDSQIFEEDYIYIPLEPIYDQIEPQIVCSYGYFYYNEECFQCPAASQQNILECAECLQNPQGWASSDFQCSSAYKHLNNKLDAIYDWVISDNYFLFHDLELVNMNNFLDECNQDSTICIQFGFDDQNPLFIECDDFYLWWKGNCILKQRRDPRFYCGQGCAYCVFDKCQYCQIDKYFMSHLDSACYLCLIPNCKYCFQYNIYNHEDVSAKQGTTLEFSTNVEDYVIACSLCYNNYIFDFSLNECVEKILQLPCLNGFITEENKEICTTYQDQFQGNLQQKQSCIELIPFCFKCIKDKFGMTSCVQCLDGYYLDLFTSICLNCNTQFQDVKTCQMTSSSNDNWKFEVESFYLNFLPSQTQLLIINDFFRKLYDIIQCADGLVIFSNACAKLQEENCYQFDMITQEQLICFFCDSLSNEYEIFSYFNSYCQICPYPCSFCIQSSQDQINSINSEFILDDNTISQTYQCLMQSEEREKTYLSTENFNIQQRDQDGLRFKMKIIEVDFSEKLFQNGLAFLDLLIRNKIHTYVTKLNSTKDFLSDTLKKYVFTLQNMTLIYDGTNDTNINDIIKMLDFDSVSLNNLTFLKMTNRFIISHSKGVSVQLKKLNYSSIAVTEQQFLFSNITNLTIDSLVFRNLQVSNSTFLQIQNLFSDQKYFVIIKNLKFIGCQFLNMNFFQFDQQQYNYISITLEGLYFSGCIFQQSTFLSFQSQLELTTKIFLIGIEFEETEVYDTNFMNLPSTKEIKLQQAYLKNVYFVNSNFFLLVSSLYFKGVYMKNLTFLNSSVIQTKKSLSSEIYDFKLEDFLMQNIYFEKFSVLAFETAPSTNISMIEINQSDIKSNDRTLCFMQFSGSDVLIQKLQIKNLEEMTNFCLQSISQIQINEIKLTQDKIYQSSISLLIISDFQKINLSDFEISQLNTSNQQLILIESLKSFDSDNQLKLNLENINCFNNFLKKIQLNTQVTILSVYIQSTIEINFKKLNFRNNLILHSITDQLMNSPGLLLIDCQKGYLVVNQCNISDNTMGNSSQSLWFLLVQNIQMDQMKIVNVNQNLEGKIQYEIQSIGGFSRIVTQNLTVTNSQFQNILSQTGSCFYIQMKSEGILNFLNMTISSSISKTTTIPVARGGSIYIDCSDSTFNLFLNNLTINYTVSEHEGGFIYLISSREGNSIILKNIIAQNIISPQNSFLLYDCSASEGTNSIFLQNLKFFIEFKVVQSLIETNKLLDQFENIKQGFLVLINCNITTINFIFEGMAYIPIFYFEFSQKLILNNIIIMNANLYGKNLIYALDLNAKIQDSRKLQVLIDNILIKNSKFDLDTLQLQNNQTKTPQSFFKFNIVSSLSNVFIYIHKLIAIKNICQECQSGLVQFYASNERFKINIHHLEFLYNECGNLSCLELNLPQAYLINLQQGKFVRNSGGSGGAINFQASFLKISKLLFLENSAKYQGGAFSIYSTSPIFANWSQINLISNKAPLGGAIMLVNAKFFSEFYNYKCFFFENSAQKESNSVFENPSSLQLQIFKQDVETIRIKKQDSVFEMPNLNKYSQQNPKIYIPSGQQISTYKRVQNQSLNYLPYDIEMKIYAINSLGEKQYLEKSKNCSITISYENSSIPLYDQTVNFTQLNNTESYLDLSQLTVTIDPYKSIENKELSIYCEFLENVNYSFTFEVEMFLCQMGEYYYQGQCLPCPAEKGYYSIKNNSQVCTKADPKIIIANTVNLVSLFKGFWRPNYYNSEFQYCFKEPSSCEGGWAVGDSSCSKGHIGALCEECDIYNIYGNGQYFKNQNYNCEECGNFVGKVFFTFITSLIMIFSVSLTVNSVYTIFKSFKRLKMSTKYYDIIFRRNLDQSAALIKMIVNYFQILVGIHSFRLNLYFNFLDFLLPISNPFSSSTFSYNCFISLQNKIEILYTSFIIGLIFPTICFIFYIILYLTSVYFHKTSLSSTIYFTALLYLLFYAQPNIIKEIGSLLASREISGSYYISKNVSYFFYTEPHQKWIFFIILPFLIYFAFIFPLTLLYVLVKNKKYQNNEKFRQIWGYIFNDFKKDIYYWEIFKISFRELLIFILALTEENVLFKGIIMFLMLLFYYIFAKLKQPYNIGSLNLFEQQNIFICSLVIIFSCLKYQLQQTDSKNFDFLIQVILFFLLIFFLCLLFIKLVITYYNKLSAQLDIIRSIIQKKFPDIQKKSRFLKSILQLHKEKQIRITKHVNILRNTLRSQRKNEQASSLNPSNIGVVENLSLHTRHISNIYTYNYTLTLINQQGGDYVIK